MTEGTIDPSWPHGHNLSAERLVWAGGEAVALMLLPRCEVCPRTATVKITQTDAIKTPTWRDEGIIVLHRFCDDHA